MITREFDTEAEAVAFMDGVRWVNDSTATVVGLTEAGGKHVVTLRDEDGE